MPKKTRSENPNVVNIIRLTLPNGQQYNYTSYQALKDDPRNGVEYKNYEWSRIYKKGLDGNSSGSFRLDSGERVEIFCAYRTTDIRKLIENSKKSKPNE